MNPQHEPLCIRKRDGSTEPFDVRKLRRVLLRALREARQPGYYAEPLAEAIAIHLSGDEGPRPASSAYVFECCQAVLRETGLRPVARALVRHRRRRQRRRRATQVRRCGTRGAALEPWRREHVVASLERRFGLSRAAARIVSCDIEQRVLSLGYRVVDSELIEAIVRNELRAWGLLDAAVETVPGGSIAESGQEGAS